MSHSDSYSLPQAHCGSNYRSSFDSDGGYGVPSHASDAWDSTAPSYQSHACRSSTSYVHSHPACGSSSGSVSVLTVALQDAAHMAAGVQGPVGCSEEGICQDSGAHHSPGLSSAAADGTFIYGDAHDLSVTLGNGSGDQVMIGTGDGNHVSIGNGAGDSVLVLDGDHNCVTAGNGAADMVSVSTGDSNSLQAGSGAGDQVTVDTGNNNILSAGNGAGDFLAITGTGDHNTLCAGDGAADICIIGTGDNNLVHCGNGENDQIQVATGNFNVLIGGNGNGDSVTVGTGDHNVMALGDGFDDTFQLFSGNNNVLLDGNGMNDTILVGGMVGTVGAGVNAGNSIVIGDGEGDQAWGSLGNGNSYMTGAGNDLVHTGGGNDFIYVDNHIETTTPSDPFHLIGTDSEAQNLFADGGNDVFALQGEKGCDSDNSRHADDCFSIGPCSKNETQHAATDSGLGTTVMTGGGGVEKYWFSDHWGNAVITDFSSAHGDRVMIGGVSDPNISNLGPVHMSYIHSAYDTANAGAVDLLINFGGASNTLQSITLIDFKPQDTGGASGSAQFNSVTFNNPQAAEATLSHIFDFSMADNQAVTNQIASLAAQNLILH